MSSVYTASVRPVYTTQQLEIQLSVIHNYASHYLGLVIGIENPAAKSYSIGPACNNITIIIISPTCGKHALTTGPLSLLKILLEYSFSHLDLGF